jgi:hypothetical protein
MKLLEVCRAADLFRPLFPSMHHMGAECKL